MVTRSRPQSLKFETLMRAYLELSHPEPAMNLAIDEALLDQAEAGLGGELLRLWEFSQPTAVIGRGSRIAEEVDLEYCARQHIPVLRRCSGGASIVAGPGCLMYSLVLSLNDRPALRMLDQAHQFVMGSLARSLATRLADIDVQGTCDLTWQNRKFSGNSVRVARNYLLYHGTLLYQTDLQSLALCLRMPPRRPDYRQDRDHRDFLTNIPLSKESLCELVWDAFRVRAETASVPLDVPWVAAEELVLRRYSQRSWNYRH